MNSLRVLLKKEGDKMPPAQNATANSNAASGIDRKEHNIDSNGEQD